ncbi:zinc finger protein 566-like [Discoglossus pictus]
MTEKILDRTSAVYLLARKEKRAFDEVAIYFSEEEWDCLNEDQKIIYKEVMTENYQTLKSLGLVYVKPSVVSMIERGEEPYIRENQEDLFINISEDGSMSWNIPGQHYNADISLKEYNYTNSYR